MGPAPSGRRYHLGRMKASLPFGVAAVAAVLVAADCGATTASPSASTSPSVTPAASPKPTPTNAAAANLNGCVLVDRPTINGIMGWGPSQLGGAGGGPGGADFCTYADIASSSVLSISFQQLTPGSGATAVQAAIAAQGDFHPLTGIGDAAGDTFTPNSAILAFSKGQVMVVLGVSTQGGGGPALEPKLETLAKRIADKL